MLAPGTVGQTTHRTWKIINFITSDISRKSEGCFWPAYWRLHGFASSSKCLLFHSRYWHEASWNSTGNCCSINITHAGFDYFKEADSEMRHHVSGRGLSMFRRNLLPPSSQSKCKPRKQAASRCFLLVSCLSSSLTLKIEAVRSFVASANFYCNIGLYIPDVNTLQSYVLSHCTPLNVVQSWRRDTNCILTEYALYELQKFWKDDCI